MFVTTSMAGATSDVTSNLNALWLLVAAALVLLMTPGVAFFYGGMVKAKSVISMMMMSFGAIALGAVVFVLYGYSMAFSQGSGWAIPGLVGNPFASFALIPQLTAGADGAPALTARAFAGFQAPFAIIPVALISGAIADRAKFGSWMVFAGLWATVVYFPVAHWVFAFNGAESETGGWIANKLLAIDLARGTPGHLKP